CPVQGIRFVLITGCRWRDLPREERAPPTVWRRRKRWGEAGVWERLWRTARAARDRQGQRDWTRTVLEGSLAPAQGGGGRGGLSREGPGTTWMLGGEGTGGPWGCPRAGTKRAEEGGGEGRGSSCWPPAGWLARVAVLNSGPSSGSRTAALIGAGGAVFCAGVVSAGVFPPSGVPRTGRPSGAPGGRTPRGEAWWGTFRRRLIRGEWLFRVYRSGRACAVLLLCMRRVT